MPDHGGSPVWRRLLDRGWQLAKAVSADDPPPASPGAWLAIDKPAPVAAALQALGLWSIDGPARPFDDETWWYRLVFDAPKGAEDRPANLPTARWVLGLDGLATCVDVWFNGACLLSGSNMFRGHALDLPGLRQQHNELLLHCKPMAAALGPRRPRPRWRVPMVAHQQLRWFRTTLLGRTPGWSPPAAVVGPWRDVWLARRDELRLADWRVQTRIDGTGVQEQGRLALHMRWEGGDPGPCRVRLERMGQVFEAPSTRSAAMPDVIDVKDANDANDANDVILMSAELAVSPLDRWWPHTHGDPALYTLSVVRQNADGSDLVWPLGRIGFRELTVDSEDGGFGLRVNGVAVFCRGACWMPLDTLRLHAAPADYAAVLAQVRQAGMNMLRVPGNTVYEHDAFHAACDAAGVMVWQDLMFANMDYPFDDPAFAEEVRTELAQQLPRWQCHASLAVVCGNSEVSQQAAMSGAERGLWSPALFEETIPALVAQHLPGVPYWPSSAHGGAFPFQPSVGTTSYYGVGAYRRPFDDARQSGLRFATECLALAQVPCAETLARVPGLPFNGVTHNPAWKARVPRDLGAGWDFDDVRDHYAERLLGEPLSDVRASDPTRYLALARAAGGEVLAAAFDQWRRADSACRGALVWTLRDLWAGAGWGLLDDRCRPKPAWHALARTLQPLHLALLDEGLDGLCVHLVNDSGRPVEGELEVAMYQHDEVPVAQGRIAVRLAPRASARHSVSALLPHFIDAGWAYRFGPRPVSLVTASLACANGPSLGPRCWFAPGVLARRRPDIGLTGSAHASAGQSTRRVLVQTRGAAWGVHFESDGWCPRDEFFHLPPGAGTWVDFEPDPATAGPSLRPPPWRVMVTALNTHQAVTVPEPVS